MHSDPLFSEFVVILQLYEISLYLIHLLTCSRLEYTEISLRIGNPFHCGGDFPGGTGGKESACHAGDVSLILGLRRSPEGGHGSPLQYLVGVIP